MNNEEHNKLFAAHDMCGECWKDDLDCECCPICRLSDCEHDATDWLLSTKANAEALREAIAEMEAGNTVEGDLEEDDSLESEAMTTNDEFCAYMRSIKGIFSDCSDEELEQAGFCTYCNGLAFDCGGCREARLQELLAEFEAAFNDYAGEYDGDPIAEDVISHVAEAKIEKRHLPSRICMIETARRYIIARDFGIFDEKQALMVWKLTYSTN